MKIPLFPIFRVFRTLGPVGVAGAAIVGALMALFVLVPHAASHAHRATVAIHMDDGQPPTTVATRT